MADWRLQGQERYLQGAVLKRETYQSYSESWDHDHCEFCGKKFSLKIPDALKVGYVTLDGYHWISDDCFDDFKEMFEWKVQTS